MLWLLLESSLSQPSESFSALAIDEEEAPAAPPARDDDDDWLLQRIRNKKQQSRVKKNYLGSDGHGCGKDCKDLHCMPPASSINGIAIDDGKTVEANTVESEKTKWTGTASIRFNVADVQRPLAAASKVAQKGNRVVMEADGGFIQNIATGEKINLRVDRGVNVFDVKFDDGTSGAMALDS